LRKLFSILLLLLFPLFHMGYYFVYIALVHQNDQNWIAMDRKDLNPARLRTVSYPITLPYQADQSEFTNLDLSIQIDGKFYRVIKGRYARDTLHLVYVDDYSNDRIHNMFSMWVGQITGQQKATKDHFTLDNRLEKPFYKRESSPAKSNLYGISVRYPGQISMKIEPVYLSIPVPPPEQFISS